MRTFDCDTAPAPPLGLNLFASQAIFNQSLGSIYRGVIPFVLINFATLFQIG